MLESGQVADHGLVECGVECEGLEVLEVDAHFDVGKPILQRRRHLERRALVSFAVTGRENDHVVGADPLTQRAVEHDLVRTSLYRRGGVGKLVEQDDRAVELVSVCVGDFCGAGTGGALGQHRWDSPFNICLAAVVLEGDRDTAKVSGFHLGEADIDELEVQLIGDLFDHRGLCNAGSAPDEKTATLFAALCILEVHGHHVLDGDRCFRRLDRQRIDT